MKYCSMPPCFAEKDSGTVLDLIKWAVARFRSRSANVGTRVGTAPREQLFHESGVITCLNYIVQNRHNVIPKKTLTVHFRYEHSLATDPKLCDVKTYFARNEDELRVSNVKRAGSK